MPWTPDQIEYSLNLSFLNIAISFCFPVQLVHNLHQIELPFILAILYIFTTSQEHLLLYFKSLCNGRWAYSAGNNYSWTVCRDGMNIDG